MNTWRSGVRWCSCNIHAIDLMLLSAITIIVACCLWNHWEGRSQQFGTTSSSLKMSSLRCDMSVARFPAEVQIHRLTGQQTWCSSWGPSTLKHIVSFNKRRCHPSVLVEIGRQVYPSNCSRHSAPPRPDTPSHTYSVCHLQFAWVVRDMLLFCSSYFLVESSWVKL